MTVSDFRALFDAKEMHMNEITVTGDKVGTSNNRTGKTVYVYCFDDGVEYTVPELSKLFDIPASTIYSKLNKQIPIREILGIVPGQKKPAVKPKIIDPNSIHFIHTIDGQSKTLQEWINEYGVSIQTYRQRRKSGLSPEEAITRPVREFKGSKLPRPFHSAEILGEEFGIDSEWIKDIMKREGMTADEAVNYAINHGVSADAFFINGKMLKCAREATRMDTWDLAEKARLLSGLPFTGKMIHAVEAGRRKLCASEIIILCDVIKTSPEKITNFRDILEQLSRREDIVK